VVRVYGSEHDDELTGFPEQPNFLAGQGGDDRVTGGVGPDVLFGDNARATKVSGDDIVYGGAGSDSITPGRGDDIASGGSGADYFYARPGEPSGSDQLRGGRDDDWIEDVLGAGDRDRYYGSGGSDGVWLRTRFVRDGKVVHPSGRIRLDGDHTTFGDRPATGTTDSLELVILPVGAWRLFGTADAERLWAPRGVTDPKRRGVTIRGGGGDDSLIGTPYDDVLVGGEGADQACGRGGDDEIDAEEQTPDPVELCDPR
jgi:Ca2+-binding RTX toxin-like protein